MKTLYTDNSALIELLTNNGISIICNEQMEMTISDEDAERIPTMIEELAPAAISDYTIE